MEYKFTSNTKKAVLFATAAVALAVSGSASALPLENPLGDSFYNQGAFSPKIDMTNIQLSYTSKSSTFAGVSTSSTKFTLTKKDLSTASFTGAFSLKATMSGTGTLASPGAFSFTSNNSMFGFGKDKYGNAKTGTVFAGQLDTFGWSAKNARVEFGSSHFSGWACAQGWCTPSERVFFHMNDNTLDINKCMSSVTAWSNKASGTAVIPVPAAAWLFGSGLVGLVGVAKRKSKS